MANKKETDESPTFLVTPFLLTSVEKDGGERHFVIDTCEGVTIDIRDNGDFVQNFTWAAHKASEEEIEKYRTEDIR